MPIYVGHGGAVKSAHPSVGYGGAVHPANYVYCGYNGAVKKCYDYTASGVSHIEYRFDACDTRKDAAGSDLSEGTSLGTTRAILNQNGSFSCSNSGITLAVKAGTPLRATIVRATVYAVYRNGYKATYTTAFGTAGVVNITKATEAQGVASYNCWIYPQLKVENGWNINPFSTDSYTLTSYGGPTNYFYYKLYSASSISGYTWTQTIPLPSYTISNKTYTVKCVDAIA